MERDYQLCNGKRCLSRREANQMISDAHRRNHNHHSKRIPKRAYYCEACGTYHLTSKNYGDYS